MNTIDAAFIFLAVHLILSYVATRRARRFYGMDSHRLEVFKPGTPNDLRFRVIIPMYKEATIVAAAINRFAKEFGDKQNVTLYFVVHSSDATTIRALDEIDLELKNAINVVINTTDSHSKASQINAAIAKIIDLDERDILSIYDIDSIPNKRALEKIEAVHSFEIPERIGAFQQTPFYPIEFHRNILWRIARARAIYSLHYHLAHELPAYKATGNKRSTDMAVHLTGHGEHILFRNLKLVGGFREPSCDSSLGFSISYRNLKILPIPVPDVGQTPSSIAEIWSQGIRWYRGCDLYWREFFDAGVTIRSAIRTGFNLWNNLRWFALVPVVTVICLMYLGTATIATFWLGALVFFLVALRHFELHRAYVHLCDLCVLSVPRISLGQWYFSWLAPYLIVRFIWSFVPIWYYVKVISSRQIEHSSTIKDIP